MLYIYFIISYMNNLDQLLINYLYIIIHNNHERSSLSSSPRPTPSTPTLPANAITITSPQDGQQVPVGRDL